MSQTNVQFSVASHMMAAMGMHGGEGVRSAELAASVNADASFVRRVLSKLAKAGLVCTTRGKNGTCVLARPPSDITLLDIYRASAAPAAFAMHSYPVEESCQVSRNMKLCMESFMCEAQNGFEQILAKRTLADILAKLQQGR